jgi:hypothetical protein
MMQLSVYAICSGESRDDCSRLSTAIMNLRYLQWENVLNICFEYPLQMYDQKKCSEKQTFNCSKITTTIIENREMQWKHAEQVQKTFHCKFMI